MRKSFSFDSEQSRSITARKLSATILDDINISIMPDNEALPIFHALKPYSKTPHLSGLPAKI